MKSKTEPRAIAPLTYLQWRGAMILYLESTLFTFYSAWCLIELQKTEDKTYSDIANRCMGNPRFAQLYVRPFQMLVLGVVTVIMLITIGWGYMAIDEISTKRSEELLLLSQSGWIGIAGITFLIFALIPNLSQQWILSIAGTLTGITIAIMVIAGSAISIREGNSDETHFGRSFDTTSEYIFSVFNAFGIIALAYGGHSVMPDIQSSLKCNQEESEKKTINPTTTNDATTTSFEQRRQMEMKKGLMGAYCIIGPCLLLAGILGYAAFGSEVTGFVIDDISVHMSDSFLMLVWIFFIVNAIAIGCIYCQVAFTLIEDIFPKFFNNQSTSSGSGNTILPHATTSSASNVSCAEVTAENYNKEESSSTTTRYYFILCCSIRPKHLIMRIMFVSICTLTAAAFPFFDDLGGLIGAIGFLPLTFVYPLLFWNFSEKADTAKSKNDKWRIRFNWIMIICWTIVGLCGVIGSTYFIIQDSTTFGIFPQK